MTKTDRTFAAARPAWGAWILANEERSIRDYLAAVDEGTPDTRVYFRGYYHGVRSRFGLGLTLPPLKGVGFSVRRRHQRGRLPEGGAPACVPRVGGTVCTVADMLETFYPPRDCAAERPTFPLSRCGLVGTCPPNGAAARRPDLGQVYHLLPAPTPETGIRYAFIPGLKHLGFRLIYPVIGPVQQGIMGAQEGHESATVRERLQARGDEDAFFAEFVRGMMDAMLADEPPVS